MADPRARAFLILLDGSRDRKILEEEWRKLDEGDGVTLDAALDKTVMGGLLTT
jgi:hypothetical protein